MESVDLYRSLEAEVGLETGWREVGSLRLASSPERMEEIARQAEWANTFDLHLELLSPTEAQERFPSAVDRRRARCRLHRHRRLRRSESAHVRPCRGRASAWRRDRAANSRNRDPHSKGRVEALETDRGVIETEVVVNAGGMYAREIGALAGVNVPIVPMAHEYLITKPAGLPLDMPTMRDPSLLVYFRPESGGLVMGGYERHCAPWSLDGIPPDFNSKLLEEDWPRFEELMENAIVRVPGLSDMEVIRLVNGPEAFTPDGEFVLGPSERARLLGRNRFLRPRSGRRGRDGKARRGVDRRRHAVPRRLAHGLAPLRSRLPEPRVHPRAHEGDLRDVLRREVPGARAAGRAAAPGLSDVRAPHGARCGLRGEVRLGACELVRAQRCAGRRVAAAARMGREAVVARDRGRARRVPRERGALRRDLVREARSQRRRRGRLPRAPLREPRRARGRPGHVHADAEPAWRHRVRLHRHAPRRGSLPDRHGHRLRPARPRLAARARSRRRLRADRGRHVAARLLRALGAEGARDPPAAHDRRSLQRVVPVHDGAASWRSGACRAWRYG